MHNKWLTVMVAAGAVGLIPAAAQSSDAAQSPVPTSDWRNYLPRTHIDWHPDIGITRRIGSTVPVRTVPVRIVSAPEVASADAAGALTLFAGGLLLLRNRRAKRVSTF